MKKAGGRSAGLPGGHAGADQRDLNRCLRGRKRPRRAPPIYKDRIATQSDVVVERLESNGAVILRQIETRRSLGAGAQTPLTRCSAPHANPLGFVAVGRRFLRGCRCRTLAQPAMAWLAAWQRHGRLAAQNPASLLRGFVGLPAEASAASPIRPTFKIDRNLDRAWPMGAPMSRTWRCCSMP